MEFTPTDPNGNAVMADVCGAAMKSDTRSAALQMKPLTAVPAALHTICNICKTIDHCMAPSDIHLPETHSSQSVDFCFEEHRNA